MNLKTFILLLVVVIIATAGIYLYIERPACIFGPEEAAVNSFEECIAAGYVVLESFPRQCKTPGGETFVEDIGNVLEKTDLIRLDTPQPNETITSPLTVKGEARGYWFFEADFPVKLFNEKGDLIVLAIAQAKSDWMTEDFVPFEATLEFQNPGSEKGTLVLEKDNPSGLPENADELRIPIVFETKTRTVRLYYYNQDLDKDESGNISCSRAGLVPLEREITWSKTPIQDTIQLLLRGELTEAEEVSGITTEYPLEGLSLKGVSLNDGVLTLEFDDPSNRTGGGSCRVGILWFQIEATAKQFPEVEQVRFMPEELFQP